MNTYLKLTSVKPGKNCNCISPFYINGITGINPNTGREYSNEDLDIMKTALYRISAAKGCTVTTCCDPDDPTSMPDENFTKQFKQKYPKIMPMYEGSQLISIKLSATKNVKESGWQDPSPYFICKITKATIKETSDPNVNVAVNLVNDCYNDSCSAVEKITVDNLLQNSKTDMGYTSFDDARVTQAILEGNISYVKEYIRKYKQLNMPLTNDDYRNRMIHLAAASKNNEILLMLISLKANLTVKNKLGETPIHFAVRARNLDNIATLLTQGIDLTIPTNNGETPMFYAMATGDMRVINMLYTNNSPVLGVDNLGNNLIHYCILNCPSYQEDDTSVPNTKSEIITWLINHGVSSEQKNKAGITPLELTKRQINREINKECSNGINADKDEVIEKFFGGSSTDGNLRKRYNAVKELNVSEYTPEHVSLLDIQTKLFNNVIRNNPKKYNDYISVDDIPIGAPIEVLDTVCVGANGLTGNEDSDECIAKGGKIVKVKNKTTKIKLELLPEEESATDTVDQHELYFNKNPKPQPKGTIPQEISNYNASVKRSGSAGLLSGTSTRPTVGLTYPIATGSNNLLDSQSSGTQSTKIIAEGSSAGSSAGFSSASTDINSQYNETPITTSSNTVTAEEHPSILDENNAIVSKCKADAKRNSEKIIATTTTSANLITNPASNPTITKNYIHLINDYKNYIAASVMLILLIIIAVIGYNWYLSSYLF